MELIYCSYILNICIIEGCNPPCGPGLRCKNKICIPSNMCFSITKEPVESGIWTCDREIDVDVDDPLNIEKICVIWNLGCTDGRRMKCTLACVQGVWYYQVKYNF